MTTTATEMLADQLATAARAFSRLGYVHAFGHVSCRIGSTMLISPTRPGLSRLRGVDVLRMETAGGIPQGSQGTCPIEVPLHLSVYAARPDVTAICRTHAPQASAWPVSRSLPPILHGFGGIAAKIARYDDLDLVHDQLRGSRAAACLGSSDALMLSGNGVLTVGSSLAEAAARMWSLEERCMQAVRQGAEHHHLTAADIAARRRWYPAEIERIWLWLQDLGSAPQDVP